MSDKGRPKAKGDFSTHQELANAVFILKSKGIPTKGIAKKLGLSSPTIQSIIKEPMPFDFADIKKVACKRCLKTNYDTSEGCKHPNVATPAVGDWCCNRMTTG